MSWLLSADGFIARFGALEFSELTDRDNSGMPDADVVQTAIAYTEAEVEDYITGRYIVPMDAPPRSLLSRAYDILRYRLHDESPPEEVRRRYQDAVSWLKEVRDGRVDLAAEERISAASGGYAAVGRANTYGGSFRSAYDRLLNVFWR